MLVEHGGRGAGAGLVAGEQPRPDLAAAAAAERDEVAAVLGERGEPGQRRLAGVLEVGGADDAAEIAPAPVVAGEEHQVVAAGAGGACGGGGHRGRPREVADVAVGGEGCGCPRRCGRVWGIGRALRSARRRAGFAGGASRASLDPIPALRASRRHGRTCRFVRRRIRARLPRPAARADGRLDGELDADDGLDAGRLAGLVEAHGAVEPLVVGGRQGRHAHAGGGGHQLGDAAGAVAEREVRVRVQVDEAHGRLRPSTGVCATCKFAAAGSAG